MPVYRYNGDVYDIPEEKVDAFEKQFPDATVSLSNNGDVYDIPISKKGAFLKQFPNAQLYSESFRSTEETERVEQPEKVKSTDAKRRAFHNKMMGVSTYADRPPEQAETAPQPEAPVVETKPFEPLNLPYNGEFQPEQTEQVNVPEAPANAEQMQADYERQREISRYAPGWQEGKPYSIDEAIEIGKRTDAISPLVNTYKGKVEEISAKYKDFLDSLEKTEDGKFKINTREDEKKFNEYVNEIKPYIDARSEFDEMLKTPAGQEFTALWGKLTPLMNEQEEDPNAERALEITMIQAELAKNPIYRSLAGKDAPTESQIRFNILSAEKDVWKEREEQATNGSYRREIRGKLDAIKAEMLENTYFQDKVQKDIVDIEKELGELDRKLEPVRAQMRRSKTGVAVVSDLPEGYEMDVNRAQELRRSLTKLQHIRDKNTSDFFANMADVFSDANFLTQGVYGLKTLINAKLAEKSPEAEGAKALLEAIVKRQEAEQTEGEFVNWVGRAGQQTANMIPFVASIGLVNGWSSVAKAVGGGAEKWLYSKLTKEAAEKLGNRFLIHTLGTTLGDVTAGIVSANTIGLGNTAHNIAERYFGQLVKNEDGSYSFKDGENFLAAFAKGEVSGSLEYWSERFGDHLQHLLGQGVLRFAASRPRMQRMAEFIGKSLDTEWADIGLSNIETKGALSTLEKIVKHSADVANRFGIQGYPFEVIEEEVNILGNIIFQTGDNSWKDFRLDSDTQVDIWGGMLFSIGSMQAVSLASSGIAEGLNAYANNKTYKMLESNLGALADAGMVALGEEKWADIQYEVDNSSNKDLPAIIQRVATSNEYSPAEREFVKRYIEQTYIYRGFNQGTLEFAKARILGDKSLRSLNINETLSFAETEIGDAYMLGFQSKDSDDAKINTALETQRQRISQMFGVEDMSREQAMGVINNAEASDEQRDAALDYLMALASADGVADRKKAQHNARLAVEDASLIRQFHGQVSRPGPDGRRIAESAFIDGPDGEPMQIFIVSDQGTDKGIFPARGSDGKVYMVGRGAVYSIDENGNKIPGQTTVTDYNQFLEDRVSVQEAQEAEQKQQVMDAEEHSETLSSLVGKCVYIAGDGAYSPMKIERLTQNGQSVVISGDKDALKGVASSAGIAFPGGSMLEIPIENLYPLLAKDDDGTLSIGNENGQAIPETESEESLKDLVGEEVQIMQNGTPITVRVNKVENGKVQYITDGTGGALVGRYMPIDEFMKAMKGTEMPVAEEPVVGPQPAPAPAPEPAPVVVEQEPQPEPAPAGEKNTIPVDKKSGEPIYDHPDVEPVQAYDDIYGKLSQKNADKFVIGQYDAAKKNLEEAQRVVTEGEEEKARIDEWEIKAGEGVNAFQRRVASAKAKVDERIAKAQADLQELQRKVDFWNQLRVVAQDNIRQREAELRLDMEPRDISELIAQELTGLFRSGKKLYLPSVLAFVGEDKRKELLKKYPGCFTDDASNSITLDDWATNVLAGSENGNMVTDTHAAADEAAQMLLNMGRAELRDFVEQARKQEKKEAEMRKGDEDPVSVVTGGKFKTGDSVSFPVNDEGETVTAYGVIVGVDGLGGRLLIEHSEGMPPVSVMPNAVEAVEDDLPLSVVAQKNAILEDTQEKLWDIERRMAEAKTDEERNALLQEKVTVLKDMYDAIGVKDTVVATLDNVAELYEQSGASPASRRYLEKMIAHVKSEGKIMRGFYDNNFVFVIADDLKSAEDALLAQIHEEKHYENSKNNAITEALDTGITDDEMRTALQFFTRTNEYSGYNSVVLADEVLANAAEIAEKYGVEAIPERLRAAGITNEDFINFVQKNIENGRRNGQRLPSWRRYSLQHDAQEVNGGQNGRNPQSESRDVDRQGYGTDGGSRQTTRSGEAGGEVTDAKPLFSISKESQELFDAAKERFGTTRDIREAGYVLPDGAMLDFSGRHSLAPGSDSSYLSGRRAIDHRDIEDLNFERDLNTASGRNTNMADFISRGAIRIHYPGAINLANKPTPEQISVLSRLIDRSDGDVWVEFGAGTTEHYVEYESARPSRIINDINRYYDEGVKPEGNLRFSIAYHGSLADFDRFDHSHMGEGEGAQVHGWGTYVSLTRKTALGYANRWSEFNNKFAEPYWNRLKTAEKRVVKQKEADKDRIKKFRKIVDSKNETEIKKRLARTQIEEIENNGSKYTQNAVRDAMVADRELDIAYEVIVPKGFFNEGWNVPAEQLPALAKATIMLNRAGRDADDVQTKLKKAIEKNREKAEALPDSKFAAAFNLLQQTTPEDWESKRNLYTIEIPDDTGENYLQEKGKVPAPFRKRIADVIRSYDRRRAELRHPMLNLELIANRIEDEEKEFLRLRQYLVQMFGTERWASRIFNEAGFVGIKYIGGQDGPCAVIFSENDAPVTEHLRFSFANNNQRIFISNAEAAVERIRMDKATPEQWLSMLEKNGGLKAGEDKWIGLSDWLKASGKKTITKQEVIDYIGQNAIQIDEQPYVEEERIDNDLFFDWDKYLENKYGPIATDAFFFMGDGNGGMNAYVESSERAVEFYNIQHPDTPLTPEEDEYGGISLTDEEYDVLLDFGEQIMKEAQDAEAEFEDQQGIRPINDVRRAYTTEGLENKREIALTVPTIEPWNERDEIHFGDAGGGRAVAWVRFGDTTIKTPVTEKELQEFKDSQARPEEYESMTNANGRTVWFPFGNRMSKDFIVERDGRFTVYINEVAINTEGSLEEAVNSLNDHVASYRPNELATRSVLVIDEIQSKRHQEGREHGYQSETPDTAAPLREELAQKERRYAEIESTIEQDYDNDQAEAYRLRELQKDARNATEYEQLEQQIQAIYERIHTRGGEYNRLRADIRELKDRIEAEQRIYDYKREGRIPDAPFEKNWHELAMKRMLRLAAEEGYDYVAWTTGEQQAERYDIGSTVNSIRAYTDPFSKEKVYAIDTKSTTLAYPDIRLTLNEDGIVATSNNDEFKGKPLSEVVGKDLANRMMSLEEGDEISGEGLRIGGEGMKGFYDDILPRFMNKYGKKWGVKVEDINLPKLGSSDEFAASGMEGIKMHAVPVTDEMREDVMEGQPMFSIVTDQKKIKELDAAEKETGYRTVVLNPDGSMSSPMAGGLSEARKGKSEAKSVRTSPFYFGMWEQSEENPHLADENGKIKLNKTDNANRGLVDVDAVDYNPYIHLRLDTINRQFKDAWKRPDLIYVKSEVPKSEVDGSNPYKAIKAAKSTGVHDWNGGQLMLSRYDKPIEQVSWEDVADSWAKDKEFIEKGVKFDIVPPQILDNLAERGIKILPPSKGKDKNEAYKAWLRGDTEAYESWRDTGKAPEDGGFRASVAAMDRMSTDKTLGAITEKMGIPVKQASPGEMPKGHTTDKGYYNPSTGEVTVCMDNVTDERDAIATVLHESVGYRGLDGLLGSRMGNTLAQAYSRLGEEGRAYVNSVIARDGLNPGDEGIGRAVIEYLSGLAERKDYNNQEWFNAGDALGEAVDSLIGTDGFSLTDNEQAYMLRAVNEFLKNPDWLNTAEGRALDTLMKRELGINESDPDKPTDPDGPDTGVRFSFTTKSSGKANVDFDKDMKHWRNRRRIEHQDAQHVARLALKRIMQEKKMKGYAEDADYLTRQNLASSRSATQAFEFTQQLYNPMLDAVNKIVSKLTEKLGRKVGKEDRAKAFQRVLDYIYGVSGLERNAYKNAELESKKQEELDAAREAAEKEREAARTDMFLASDKLKLDIRIKEIDDALAAKEDEITKRYDGKKRDWSGITSLMEMKPDEWERAEAFAQDFIDAFKDELGPEADALLNELWNRIRACTDYSLEHAYKYGLLTREEFERLHGTASRPRMWNYYVPLRGFKDKTAEEEYDYGYGSITSGGGVVEKAKGRWSEAENPLANIMHIALREIVQGNDNWAKQALLQFVLDAGENTLLSIRDPWFVKDDTTGKWVLAEPLEDKTTGYSERIEDFEKRMNDLKNGIRADGTISPTPLAKKGRKGLKLDMIMANKANQNSHMIRLKIHGIEQVIWVNGNAGLAKTVMGQRSAAENMKFFRSISRKLSNLFTTWSINFSIRNLIRDTRYSRRRLRVMEDRAYRHQYNKNWIKNFGYVSLAAPMVSLMYKWKEGVLFEKEKAGTLTDKERMFMDFMRDGGQTGYTVIQTVDSIKKDLEKAMEQARGGKSKVNIPILRYVFEFIPTLNEGFELLTRFTAYQTSRDMGRSGQRAASDAKEISVNFNRRGAQSGEGFWGWTAAYLGATHYFYNASVQGFDNLAQLFKAKPINMTAKMADFAIMGIIMPFLNSALAGLASAMGHGGDDDDDWYWDLPEYVRRNFVVIGTPKGYLTLPLPPEFRAAYGLGDIVASLMNHKATYEDGFQIGLDIMTQFAEVLPLNPVEGYNASSNQKWYEPVVRAVTPDIFMFAVDAVTNRDYTGRPLYKENPFSHTKPLSQGAYASTPKYLVDACMKLAEVTSDTALAPYFDWSPGIIRDAMKNFGGGPYKLFEDVLKIVDHDEERPSRWDNVPFFSGFTGHLDEDRRDSFEANALRYYKDNMESVVRRLNSAAGVNDLSPSDIFDPKKFEALPEEVKSNVRFQKILAGEDYNLAELYWKGMQKQLSETSFHFDVSPKTGNLSKTPKPDVERESLDKLRDTWKELRKQWHEMPNKTEEEKRAKKAFEETVQEAWHQYYNAEGDILDALMREEYDHVSQKIKNGIPYEPKPNISERVFNAAKGLKNK